MERNQGYGWIWSSSPKRKISTAYQQWCKGSIHDWSWWLHGFVQERHLQETMARMCSTIFPTVYWNQCYHCKFLSIGDAKVSALFAYSLPSVVLCTHHFPIYWIEWYSRSSSCYWHCRRCQRCMHYPSCSVPRSVRSTKHSTSWCFLHGYISHHYCRYRWLIRKWLAGPHYRRLGCCCLRLLLHW